MVKPPFSDTISNQSNPHVGWLKYIKNTQKNCPLDGESKLCFFAEVWQSQMRSTPLKRRREVFRQRLLKVSRTGVLRGAVPLGFLLVQRIAIFRHIAGIFIIYHLVMTNSSPWKDPPMLLIDKSSISMGHFPWLC